MGFAHERWRNKPLAQFSSADSPQEAKLAENTCTLVDLTEGQVGKLLIRKSGKVQLLLGKVTLDVTMGTTCSFLQV
jgi:DNA-directed RNA polymerase III subunit RPC4